MKLEKLSLEKFSTASIALSKSGKVYGGAPNDWTNENLDDGGATCDTPGGTAAWGSYDSDTQGYDRNGTPDIKEYHTS